MTAPGTTLDDLKPGQCARVLAVACSEPALAQRLMEMGLLDGELVEFVGTAPLGDPVEVRLGDYRLSLRVAEARLVRVEVQN